MTPAENPSAIARNLVLVCLVKKAIVLPIPVASPAIRVRENASSRLLGVRLRDSIHIPFHNSLLFADNSGIIAVFTDRVYMNNCSY